MIVHVVRLRFKDGARKEDIDRAMKAARENILAEGRTAWWCEGPIMGNPLEQYTYSIVCGFTALEDYLHFLASPAHRKNDFLVHPLLAGGTSYSVSDDHDPAIEKTIVETTRRALESDPERLNAVRDVTQAEGRLKGDKWL